MRRGDGEKECRLVCHRAFTVKLTATTNNHSLLVTEQEHGFYAFHAYVRPSKEELNYFLSQSKMVTLQNLEEYSRFTLAMFTGITCSLHRLLSSVYTEFEPNCTFSFDVKDFIDNEDFLF